MNELAFQSKDLKYLNTETDAKIYREMRRRGRAYFKKSGYSKGANIYFWLKIGIYLCIAAMAYNLLLTTTDFRVLVAGYVIFGFANILAAMNLGHDAAHQAVTGNKKIDDGLFRMIFWVQGLSGYLWQIRHNYSHHILPNVYEEDSDMDMSGVLILDPHDPKKPIHKYQHFYAPIVYIFGSLIVFFYQDFEMLKREKHGNLLINKVPIFEWLKFAFSKTIHLSIFLFIPLIISALSWQEVLFAYLIMHFSMSLFMVLTFAISHHVMEAAHAEIQPVNRLNDTWVRHQIITTVDFNENSPFANFLFGGFNLHVAHHIFPEVSHIHYPELTKIIKEVLAENNCSDWYKSHSFFDGCVSHFKYLKSIADTVGQEGISVVKS